MLKKFKFRLILLLFLFFLPCVSFNSVNDSGYSLQSIVNYFNLNLNIYAQSLESEGGGIESGGTVTLEEDKVFREIISAGESSDTSGSQISLLSSVSSTEYSIHNTSALKGLMSDNKFQNTYQEFDLSKGTLRFSEIDMDLPGKNGLDLQLGRSYDSRLYRKHNEALDFKRGWAPGMGFGWQSNAEVRATVIWMRDMKDWPYEPNLMGDIGAHHPIGSRDLAAEALAEAHEKTIDYNQYGASQILLEGMHGRQIYIYDETLGYFKSETPGNHTKLYLDTDTFSIRMENANGRIYHFNDLSFVETQRYKTRQSNPYFYPFVIAMSYLSSVEDRFGNKIRYTYEPVGEYEHRQKGTGNWKKLGDRLHDNYSWILYNWTGASEFIKALVDMRMKGFDTIRRNRALRIKHIVDTYDRRIDFKYYNPIAPYQITGFNYPNALGQQNTIRYQYAPEGHLLSVALNHKTVKRYESRKFDTPEDEDKGFLLSAIETDAGSRVEYEFEDDNTYHVLPYFKLVFLRHLSNVVYTKKRFYADKTNRSDVLDYTFSYPSPYKYRWWDIKQLRLKHPDYDRLPASERSKYPLKDLEVAGDRYKELYKPSFLHQNQDSDPNNDVELHAFNKVHVKTPDSVVDEVLYFKQGRLTKHVIGGDWTESDWDFAKGRKKWDKVYKRSKLREETVYEAYDAYSNPVHILRKVDNKDYQRIKNTYSTAPEHLSKNMNRLLVKSETIALSDGNAERLSAEDGTRGQSRIRHSEYTSQGLLQATYVESKAFGKVKMAEFVYDSLGRVKEDRQFKATGALTKRFTYSSDVAANTYTVKESVDVPGFPTTETQRIFNLNAYFPIESIDAHGRSSKVSYDELGRVIKRVDIDGKVTTIAYSNDHKTVTITTDKGQIVQHYDGLGRLLETNHYNDFLDEKFEYFMGKLVKQRYRRNPSSQAWILKETLSYDNQLRVIARSIPHWGTIVNSYDDVRNINTVTDYIGRRKQQGFDGSGLVLWSANLVTGDKVYHYYNGFGEKMMTIDADGIRHALSRDSLGRVVRSYYPYRSGSPKVNRETVYDAYGETASVKVLDKSGQVYRSYSYDTDALKRPIQTQVNGQVVERYGYGESGYSHGQHRLTSVESDGVKSGYHYDTLGRVVREDTLIKTNGLNYAHSIRTAYTDDGKRSQLSYPDGSQVRYVYNDLDQLLGIDYRDLYGKVQRVVSFTYWDDGELKSRDYGNGYSMNYHYEHKALHVPKNLTEGMSGVLAMPQQGRNGVLTDIIGLGKVANANASEGEEKAVRYHESHTFDRVGNIIKSRLPHPKTNVTAEKRYVYNSRDELEQVGLMTEGKSYPEFKKYKYSRNGAIYTYSVPDGRNKSVRKPRKIDSETGQLVFQQGPEGRVYFDWDPEGNLVTAKSRPSRSSRLDKRITQKSMDTVYDYDYMGQLRQVRRGVANGTLVPIRTYTNRSDGMRVYSQEENRVYFWDLNEQSIGEYDTKLGKIMVKYIYVGNEKVAMIRPTYTSKANSTQRKKEDIYWFVNNLQGTGVRVLDAGQDVVRTVNVDGFGNPVMPLTEKTDEWNYTGKKYDRDTGLYYFNARYYSPKIGLFLQPDPVKQTYNPYLYAGNNPLRYVDADGRFFKEIITAAIMGAAIVAGTDAVIQLIKQGEIDWERVGNAAEMGAVGGALSAGIGGVFKHAFKNWGQFTVKTVSHGVSSGIQSTMMGGDFWDGFSSGAVGHMAGHFGEKGFGGHTGGFAASVVGSTLSAAVTGGSMLHAAYSAGLQYGFNQADFAGKFLRKDIQARIDATPEAIKSLSLETKNSADNLLLAIPSPVFDVASLALALPSPTISKAIGYISIYRTQIAISRGLQSAGQGYSSISLGATSLVVKQKLWSTVFSGGALLFDSAVEMQNYRDSR